MLFKFAYMKEYIATLEESFVLRANAKIAAQQAKYMKGHFDYFGLKSPERREITKPFFLKASLPLKTDLPKYIKSLWQKPQREFHYFAMKLCFKYVKQLEEKDIELFEFMITHNSWWDSIDFIAPNLVGAYFKKFPEKRNSIIERWIASENLWLQRSAILFQLKYKDTLDTEYLAYIIHQFIGSKEFFINKAIGWVLREYAYRNPEWVIAFAEKTELNNLSRREALRVVLKK